MVTNEHIQRWFDAAEIHIAVSGLDADAPLALQGLDSLDMTNLLYQIEQSCQITISPEAAARLRTLADIVDYLDKMPALAARIG